MGFKDVGQLGLSRKRDFKVESREAANFQYQFKENGNEKKKLKMQQQQTCGNTEIKERRPEVRLSSDNTASYEPLRLLPCLPELE